MARQQVNVRLSSFTVSQLKELASRFDMSESTVIMLAIDRLARDTQVDKADEADKGKGAGILLEEREDQDEQQKKGEQVNGNSKATRTRRGHNP